MASAAFVQLAGGLVEAMGQRLDSAKPMEYGLVVRTSDGFLFAFLENPLTVSLGMVQKLATEEASAPERLVVLTPGHLPLLITSEVVRAGGTVVEGPRFAELARQLGLETMLGEEPRAQPASQRRLLPSAQQLDQTMQRARTWLDWGVPALALRFFRQASQMKPEYVPAKVGLGRSLLALGLSDDADRLFDEVLATHPDDVEARLGKAAVLGAKAQPKGEVEMYRILLAEDDARTEVRAHLVAALVEMGDWRSARVEIEAMLSHTPEDSQLRFLHAVSLSHTGQSSQGEAERQEARRLGLPYEREVALCQHLGLPVPPRPKPTDVVSAARPEPVAVTARAAEAAEETHTAAAPRRPRTKAGSKSAPRRSATRKRK
ncbi:MAG: tetratricopeptide repeat protein [Thermoplasmata archaeon]